jgi:hypothetical protein
MLSSICVVRHLTLLLNWRIMVYHSQGQKKGRSIKEHLVARVLTLAKVSEAVA